MTNSEYFQVTEPDDEWDDVAIDKDENDDDDNKFNDDDEQYYCPFCHASANAGNGGNGIVTDGVMNNINDTKIGINSKNNAVNTKHKEKKTNQLMNSNMQKQKQQQQQTIYNGTDKANRSTLHSAGGSRKPTQPQIKKNLGNTAILVEKAAFKLQTACSMMHALTSKQQTTNDKNNNNQAKKGGYDDNLQ